MISKATLIVTGFLIGAITTADAQAPSGLFEGEVVARFMRDGRNMKTEQPFSFVDPKGSRWDVPAGSITDGASIPQVLWLCCPPFTGKYRAAAVIHDYYCQTKARSWQETHAVFYDAMRAAGVDERQAKLMFSAVYRFGPRWRTGSRTVRPKATAAEQKEAFEQLKSWIETDNPNLDAIAGRLDREE